MPLLADLPALQLRVRDVADIVLPGESNPFGQELRWMKRATACFRRLTYSADTLAVVGFSMLEADAMEFESLLSWTPRFERIVVADPAPSSVLLDFLASRTTRLPRWTRGPETGE